MKPKTVNIPDKDWKEMEKLVENGRYINTTEIIRTGIKFVLRMENGKITDNYLKNSMEKKS